MELINILIAISTIGAVIVILFLIGWFCNETGIGLIDRNTTVSGFWMITINKGLANILGLAILIFIMTVIVYLLNGFGEMVTILFK